MKHPSRLTVALALSLLFCGAHARAQEEDAPKVEVGAQFSSLSVNIPDTPFTETQAGFGGRVTYNFTDSFAVEAEGNFFPKESALNEKRARVEELEGLLKRSRENPAG